MSPNHSYDEYRFNLLNLGALSKRTLTESKKTYHSKRRPLSLSRMLRLFYPNLHSPVFIVGSPRSGTTFLGQCIAALPEVSYHHEPRATKAVCRYVHNGVWSHSKSKFFYALVYRWLMRVHLDADLRFVEKTPRNSFIIPFLNRMTKDARFIHIIRDGRDVAMSLQKTQWYRNKRKVYDRTAGGERGRTPRFWTETHRREEFVSTSDIHRCIWAWRMHTEAVLESATTLDSGQYCEIRYESLLQSQEEWDKILSFLGIFTESSRDSFVNAITRDGHRNSIGRWKTCLSDEDLKTIEIEAGELLSKLGYRTF